MHCIALELSPSIYQPAWVDYAVSSELPYCPCIDISTHLHILYSPEKEVPVHRWKKSIKEVFLRIGFRTQNRIHPLFDPHVPATFLRRYSPLSPSFVEFVPAIALL